MARERRVVASSRWWNHLAGQRWDRLMCSEIEKIEKKYIEIAEARRIEG